MNGARTSWVQRSPALAAGVILLTAIAARLVFWAIQSGMHFPDEIFQYLEPAHLRRTGSAWLPWEYSRGLRNWTLPTLFGGWMELFSTLGLRGIALQKALWLHNVFISLAVIPGVAAIAKALDADRRTQLLAALMAAAFPVIAWLSPHTLSENFGVIFSTWGVAFWLYAVRATPVEPRRPWGVAPPELRYAFLAGLLFGLACGMRFTIIAMLPVIALDLNFRARFLALASFGAGFILAACAFGLLDLVTWGRFMHSYIEFFDYNLIEKGNRDHGVMVWHFYLTTALWERASIGVVALIGLSLAAFSRTWRLLLLAAVFVFAHSLIGHKEERFILSMWPLLVAGGAVGIAAVAARVRAMRGDGLAGGVAIAALLLCLVPAWLGTLSAEQRWRADMFAAQEWVGDQPDVTGLLYTGRIHLNGGYFIFGADVPQTPFNRRLLTHRLFNYVAVDEDAHPGAALERDFEPARTLGSVTVYRRTN